MFGHGVRIKCVLMFIVFTLSASALTAEEVGLYKTLNLGFTTYNVKINTL